jgi:hypothetical protein
MFYISGWVVRKMFAKLGCDPCRACLVTTDLPSSYSSAYHLLTLRNNGGLIVPSPGVVKTCETAEKVIRQMVPANKADNTVSTAAIISKVLGKIGSQDVFSLGQHILDTQDGIDNHHYSLLRKVISRYVTIRQYHIAKLHTLRMQGSNVRHALTKTILFKGQ